MFGGQKDGGLVLPRINYFLDQLSFLTTIAEKSLFKYIWFLNVLSYFVQLRLKLMRFVNYLLYWIYLLKSGMNMMDRAHIFQISKSIDCMPNRRGLLFPHLSIFLIGKVTYFHCIWLLKHFLHDLPAYVMGKEKYIPFMYFYLSLLFCWNILHFQSRRKWSRKRSIFQSSGK